MVSSETNIASSKTLHAPYSLLVAGRMHCPLCFLFSGGSNLLSAVSQASQTSPISDVKTHISNIGRMIEDMENDMRANLNELYILKTREVVNALRKLHAGPVQDSSHIATLNAAVLGHGKARAVDSEA
jgi:hypothetical protein